MSLLDGNKAILRFNIHLESASMVFAEGNSPWRLMNKINSTQWMGKEAGSSMLVDIQQKQPVPLGKTAMMDHAEFLVVVGYRPDGWISDIKDGGRQRLNGWQLEVRDQMNDGTLLDGHGRPLPPGGVPVYLRFRVYESADYNDYDFGDFLGEQ
jgi:hypothetical protein